MLPLMVFLLLFWIALGVYAQRELGRVPALPASPPATISDDLPLVSILLPVRNEANRLLESCIRSLLAQDYPRLEIIAVDDRSTDATGRYSSVWPPRMPMAGSRRFRAVPSPLAG